MDKAHLEQLIVGGESSKVEFKLNVPPEHVLGADLSAFANTEGGTIIFGVDHKGAIKGLTETEAKEAWVRLLRISAYPPGVDVREPTPPSARVTEPGETGGPARVGIYTQHRYR